LHERADFRRQPPPQHDGPVAVRIEREPPTLVLAGGIWPLGFPVPPPPHLYDPLDMGRRARTPDPPEPLLRLRSGHPGQSAHLRVREYESSPWAKAPASSGRAPSGSIMSRVVSLISMTVSLSRHYTKGFAIPGGGPDRVP